MILKCLINLSPIRSEYRIIIKIIMINNENKKYKLALMVL